jgi:hypothetical protein
MKQLFGKVIAVLTISVFVSSCFYYEDIPRQPQCLNSTLAVEATSLSATGCGQTNGSITALATGGSGTYKFSRDAGITKQSTGQFTNVGGGTYVITVYDELGCTATVGVTVSVTGSDFQASINTVSPDTECLTNNGSVHLSATGGTPPYTFKIGATTNDTGAFGNLAPGGYSALVSDAGSCSSNIAVTIASQSSVSYEIDIAPILVAKCGDSDCHGPDGPKIDLTKYSNVKSEAADIKSRIISGSMPKSPQPGGSLSSDQIKLIVCWIDDGAKDN